MLVEERKLDSSSALVVIVVEDLASVWQLAQALESGYPRHPFFLAAEVDARLKGLLYLFDMELAVVLVLPLPPLVFVLPLPLPVALLVPPPSTMALQDPSYLA
jgi:hypothetical protein